MNGSNIYIYIYYMYIYLIENIKERIYIYIYKCIDENYLNKYVTNYIQF